MAEQRSSFFERITGFRPPVRLEGRRLVVDLSGLDWTQKRPERGRIVVPPDHSLRITIAAGTGEHTDIGTFDLGPDEVVFEPGREVAVEMRRRGGGKGGG